MNISRILLSILTLQLVVFSPGSIEAAGDFFRKIGEGIKSGATTVGEGIKKGATTAYEGARDAGRTVQRAGESVINKGEQVVDAVKSVVNGIRDSISQIRETIKVAATLKGDVIDQFAALPDQAVQVTKAPIDRMSSMASSLKQKYQAAADLVNKKDLTGLKQMAAITQDTLITVLDSTDTLMNSVIDQVSWNKPLAGFARIIISLSQTVRVLVKLVESITVKLIGNVLEQHGTATEVNSVLQEILSVLADVQLISDDILKLSTGQKTSSVIAEEAARNTATQSGERYAGSEAPKSSVFPAVRSSEDSEIQQFFAREAESAGGHAQAAAVIISEILPQNSSERRPKLIDSMCKILRHKIDNNKLGITRDRRTISDRDRSSAEQVVISTFGEFANNTAGYVEAAKKLIRDIMRQNETWKNRIFLDKFCSQLKEKIK